MSVSKEDVKHIAKLSKLNLTEKELEKYTNEQFKCMNKIN